MGAENSDCNLQAAPFSFSFLSGYFNISIFLGGTFFDMCGSLSSCRAMSLYDVEKKPF